MSKGGIRCMLLVILLSLTFSVNVYAVEIPAGNAIDQNWHQTITRAEQTRWYYRKYNGVMQKRLWSITYGRWKTKWINA